GHLCDKGEGSMMDEHERLAISQRKWMLFFLVFFLIGASVTPYQRILLSFLLGYVVGYYGLRFLQSRVKAFGEAVVEKGTGTNLGTFIRFSGIAVVIVISLQFPEDIHVIYVVLGLAIAYLVFMINFTRQMFMDTLDSKK